MPVPDSKTLQREVKVHLLPALAEREAFQGRICVVIDILRACTTMTTALENGASAVRVTETVDQAWQLKTLTEGEILLGGERGGVLIDGFDLDNSPRAYTTQMVDKKTLLFSTTNGTKAMHHVSLASEVFIGCFRNHSALANQLSDQKMSVDLMCAGTNGEISAEDVLFAGLMARTLSTSHRLADDAETMLACRMLETVELTDQGIEQELLASQGGRNLQRLGLQQDIAFCSQLDRSAVVPVWNAQQNRVVPSGR